MTQQQREQSSVETVQQKVPAVHNAVTPEPAAAAEQATSYQATQSKATQSKAAEFKATESQATGESSSIKPAVPSKKKQHALPAAQQDSSQLPHAGHQVPAQANAQGPLQAPTQVPDKEVPAPEVQDPAKASDGQNPFPPPAEAPQPGPKLGRRHARSQSVVFTSQLILAPAAQDTPKGTTAQAPHPKTVVEPVTAVPVTLPVAQGLNQDTRESIPQPCYPETVAKPAPAALPGAGSSSTSASVETAGGAVMSKQTAVSEPVRVGSLFLLTDVTLPCMHLCFIAYRTHFATAALFELRLSDMAAAHCENASMCANAFAPRKLP